MSGNLAFLNFNAAPPLEPIEALKARIDIVDIVGRYVELKPGLGDLAGLCPFHAESTASFKADRRRQRFKCFGCGASGDVLDFLAAIERLSLVEAIKRLRELTGEQASPVVRPAPPPANNRADEEAQKAKALAVWHSAGLIPKDGIAYDYLTQRRGIRYWHPQRLRWHPHCPWRLGTAGCIVAPVNDHVTDRIVGIWRIRVALEGKVERRGIGPQAGNATRLFPAEGPRIVIAEGIEDALAAAELTGLPAWAALSAGNMARLVLPARLREVLILADADEVGRQGAHALAKRLRDEGRQARVLRPRAVKDANDALLARRAG